MSGQLDMFGAAATSPSGSPEYDAALRKLETKIRAGVMLRRAIQDAELEQLYASWRAQRAAFIGPPQHPPPHHYQRAMDMLLLEMASGGEGGSGTLVHGYQASLIFSDAMGRVFDAADTDDLLMLMVKRGLIRMIAGCAPTPSQIALPQCGGGKARCFQCRPTQDWDLVSACLSWHYFARVA